jgi:hypothetical protein
MTPVNAFGHAHNRRGSNARSDADGVTTTARTARRPARSATPTASRPPRNRAHRQGTGPNHMASRALPDRIPGPMMILCSHSAPKVMSTYGRSPLPTTLGKGL